MENKNDASKMLETFNKNKEREIAGMYLYNVISEIISKKFEGKSCTKRIATAIKDELIKTYPNIVVHYQLNISWYEVRIWGDRFGDYNNSYRLFLCYTSNSLLSKEEFAEHNTCYSEGAVERLGLCNKLTPTKVNDIISEIIKRREELEKLQGELKNLENSLPYNTEIS